MTRAAIYAAIDAERERQAALWSREHAWGYGDCSSDQVPLTVKVAMLAEECGEVARAVLDGTLNLRDDLVQGAAVAIAMLENLPGPAKTRGDRNGQSTGL
jgi:NTP pyrophosphatase (non-canonical NTP hydrolase)